MKKLFRSKAILSLALVLSLLFSTAAPAFSANAAEVAKDSNGYYFEKVDNSAIKVSSIEDGRLVNNGISATLKATDKVRVSIVLDGSSVIDEGYSTEDLATNKEAVSYITKLKKQQKSMEKKISSAIKGDLDVQWNLTVAGNIISADVQYGDLDAIASVSGVKQVVVETKYEPCSPVVSDNPNMAISGGSMTGAHEAWAKGQTGAGGRIAIIDTGLDIDHISFNNDAFLYALSQNAADMKMKTDKYMNSLNLLTAKEIETVLTLLNAYTRMGSKLTADALVLSDKIPFAFNYVDSDLNVRHIYDSQGEHGSHVTGIAASNRFLKAEDGKFEDAVSTVFCAGNAPDAQVMVMKVFGKKGGAYDSDYMAAIEDAILLGADSVNLSLGSTVAGFTYNDTYKELLDKLTTTDTVVVISAGNSGQWAEESNAGLLYGDDVNFNTGGSPGSYTNALTVASVNNHGDIAYGFTVDGKLYAYTENAEYGNEPMTTLIGLGESADFEYVFLDAVGTEADYQGIDVNGKIVIVSRGQTSFFEKANIAVNHGAIATIIYNNTSGSIGLNLTGYEKTAPCVSILQVVANEIRNASVAQGTSAAGVAYYTGTLTLHKGQKAIPSPENFYTMSSFSSFGVPGNLSLKPEITAPGGFIWSVNGSNHKGGGVDQYELMSGTSMAAPQVTGMMAVLKRYMETEKNKKFPAMTQRAIAQSLLMSTATAMKDADGNYYPVLQQGAGLANVDDAINAASLIMMKDNATVSAADGKVKAELGEDPEKTGVYSFGFTVTNLTNKKHSYTLSDAIFTQALAEGNLLASTVLMDAKVSFIVNGTNISETPVNPYTAQVDAAKAEYNKANAAYNDAVDAVIKATADSAEVNTKVLIATANLASAKANLATAQVNEKIAKALKKLAPKKYEDAVKAVKKAETEVVAAEKILNDAKAAATTYNKTIEAAVKAQAAASQAATKAEAKLSSLSLKMKSWKAPYEVNVISLAANKAVEVEVVIKLTDETKANLDENYVNGAYVEGYINLDSQDDTSSHSIPVLAFYGNWSDASMFDKGSYVENKYGLEDRAPYVPQKNDQGYIGNSFIASIDGGKYHFGGNMFANEKSYDPYHNAINNQNGNGIDSVTYTLIRNAAARAVIFADYETGEIYAGKVLGQQYAAFYNPSSGSWGNTNYTLSLGWKGTDANGNKLPEGTKVVASLIAAPEFNVDENGDIDFATLGDGAFFSTLLTIDNTAPVINSVKPLSSYTGSMPEDGTDGIVVDASDNENIAAILLYSNNGETLLGRAAIGDGDFYNILTTGLEPDIYLITVIDYAGNASTFRLFLNAEPTDKVSSIEISQKRLTMVKNNTTKLEAVVKPSTIIDGSVIWSSSNESVAVVDADGNVTAVGVGNAVITATAAINPSFKATCRVSVVEIDVNLNGVVWDEVGEVWFSEINTASLPNYKKLTKTSAIAPINGLAYGEDGTLYASSIDTSNELSELYVVDQDTFELTKVGESSVLFYADIAEAPHLDALIGLYYNYIVLIDPATGEYSGAFNYLSQSDLVGITYIGSTLNTYYNEYIDMYYLIDADGNVYMEAFINLEGSYYYFQGEANALVLQTGITSDVPFFQSLYFNGEYTFFANFNESTNDVVLYAMDLEYTGNVFTLGHFAEGVWPIAALSELGTGDAVTSNAAAKALETATVTAASVSSIK